MQGVDGHIIATRAKEFVSYYELKVEAGTNGYCGGDSGHGSRTYIKISQGGGMDFRVDVRTNGFGQCKELEIILGGDRELKDIIDTLKFITCTLEDQAND